MNTQPVNTDAPAVSIPSNSANVAEKSAPPKIASRLLVAASCS